MRRVGRERELEEVIDELPLVVRFFDVLHLNGRTTVHLHYIERRSLLEGIVPERMLTPALELSDPKEVEAMLKKAVEEGRSEERRVGKEC